MAQLLGTKDVNTFWLRSLVILSFVLVTLFSWSCVFPLFSSSVPVRSFLTLRSVTIEFL